MKKLYLVLLAMALVVSCGFSTASAKTYELKDLSGDLKYVLQDAGASEEKH